MPRRSLSTPRSATDGPDELVDLGVGVFVEPASGSHIVWTMDPKPTRTSTCLHSSTQEWAPVSLLVLIADNVAIGVTKVATIAAAIRAASTASHSTRSLQPPS